VRQRKPDGSTPAPSEIFGTHDVSRLSMEYNMMSKLQSLLISSCSAIGLALLAFLFAFGAPQVYAEDLEAVSPPAQTKVSDVSAEVPDGLGVLCHYYGDGAETCVMMNVQSAADLDLSTSAVSEIEPLATDVGSPLAIHSVDAIRVEITQTVTIAIAGETVDEPTSTGSISEAPDAEPILDTAILP
jgi:hypothetical protein